MVEIRNRRVRLLPFALLCVFACASGPPPGPSEAELAGLAAKTIIISPFNVVSALPPELEGSTKIVSSALVAHLEAHGKTVRVMGFRAGRDLWKASMKEVRDAGEKRNFENAAKVYARKIGEHLEFDAVLVPSIFIQNARMRGQNVRWDGTEERMEMRGSTGDNLYMGQGGSLNVRAASIFVYVLDREGKPIHEKRSGLELIQHLAFADEAEAGYSSRKTVRQELRNDQPPIQDEERVRAGVARVLSPFVAEEPVAAGTETQPPPPATK
jgi:hypothetical protein